MRGTGESRSGWHAPGLRQARGAGGCGLCAAGGEGEQIGEEKNKATGKTGDREKATRRRQRTRRFLLTSTLLSSDPALLRRPRFPAQNMQYHRLDTHARPGAACPARGRSQGWLRGEARGGAAAGLKEKKKREGVGLKKKIRFQPASTPQPSSWAGAVVGEGRGASRGPGPCTGWAPRRPAAPAACQQGRRRQWLKNNKMGSCAAPTAWISPARAHACAYVHIRPPRRQGGVGWVGGGN